VRPPTQADLVRVLEAEGILDDRVLDAFRSVPRAFFVPPDLVEQAYLDVPLPIPHDQVTTQPSLVARMLEALSLAGGERVLEIGTGYGFQAALLAQLASSVWSVERFADLAEFAKAALSDQRIENVHVVVGDGSVGLAEHAPYDAVVVSAAHPRVPPPLAEQLAPQGRLVQPLGPGGSEDVVLFVRSAEGLVRRRSLTGARFVRLYGRHGFS
jgi:protein-L-isoaspartate(D-aspartate) O-methyltransferase